MHTHLKTFQPDPLVGFDHAGKSALDVTTPRGCFLADSGTGYFVCDHPKRRFAIALDHPEHEPFTYLPLRQKPLDVGRWMGVGTFRLDRLLDYTAKAMFTGTLDVGDGLMRLLIQDRRKRYSLQEVARGSGGRKESMYERWTLFANGERFFRYRIGQHPPFIAFD